MCQGCRSALRHYFSCDQVSILTAAGVALRLAICHGQQPHGQRLADDYRRLSSLTASGEQVIGVTAVVQRAADNMERVGRDEARHNRDQMVRNHRNTVQRLERVNTTLQRGNTALQTQIEGLETMMAQNQQQVIAQVQSTGRVLTGAADITMRVGNAVLDQGASLKADSARADLKTQRTRWCYLYTVGATDGIDTSSTRTDPLGGPGGVRPLHGPVGAK